jgi:DNA-binding PadR family transcriptional regulator
VGRNRSAVLEFAVLGLLHRTPMHGYELSKQLNMLLGTFRALSYGTLYPCLTKLYAEGLITKEGDEPASQRPTRAPGRSKIVYRLSAEGKERFQDLLTNPGSGAWEDDEFGVLRPDQGGHPAADPGGQAEPARRPARRAARGTGAHARAGGQLHARTAAARARSRGARRPLAE